VPDTDAAWDEAFERLYTDQVLRKRLAQGARTRMEKDFDLYRNAHLWLDTYEALIAKRHPLEIVSG
jgi:glycosyltransferase involved in cell wall biosynthesis